MAGYLIKSSLPLHSQHSLSGSQCGSLSDGNLNSELFMPKITTILVPAILFIVIAAVLFRSGALQAEKARVVPIPAIDEQAGTRSSEIAVLAGGCFWGVQGVYQHVKGVTSAVSGYAGGEKRTAEYE